MSSRPNSTSGTRRGRIAATTSAIFIAVVCFTLTALGVRPRTWAAKHSMIETTAKAAAQGQPTPIRIPASLITAHPTGFEPNEITRPQGLFLLGVDNRTGLQGALVLRLDRVAGNRLIEVPVPLEKGRWRNFFTLTPGTYHLTEANHPNWVCTITITPH